MVRGGSTTMTTSTFSYATISSTPAIICEAATSVSDRWDKEQLSRDSTSAFTRTPTYIIIVNEIPKEDGKTIEVGNNTTAKFTANTAATYAYVYLKEAGKPSAIYTAVTIGEGTTITAGNDEYFEDPSGNTAVPNGTPLTVGTTYYKKYTNNNNIYGVKVVKTYK